MPVWLAQFFPALTGLVGVLLGVWLTQRGSARVARQTFEGQRTLARDAALRDYRKQQIAPYLEASDQSVRLWAELFFATSGHERAQHLVLTGEEEHLVPTEVVKQQVLIEEQKILALGEQMSDLSFNSLVSTYAAIPDEAFRDAFHEVLDAQHKLKPPFTKQGIGDVVSHMVRAHTKLNKAAEHYIFSAEKDV